MKIENSGPEPGYTLGRRELVQGRVYARSSASREGANYWLFTDESALVRFSDGLQVPASVSEMYREVSAKVVIE